MGHDEQPPKEPISLPGTHPEEASTIPLMPPERGETPAAEWLEYLATIQRRTALIARYDSFEAHRHGYVQGGVMALQYLEKMLDDGIPLGTALASCLAYWEGDVRRWAIAPGDPKEIVPVPRSDKEE